MSQQSPHHISALDFDAFVRSFERRLRQIEAPRARLQLIVEFLSDAGTVPESWLASYTESFLPHLLQLVRIPGMDGLPPEPWQLLLATCDQARRLDWLADADDLARARTAILEHLVLCFGFLGALRQLDAALFSEGLTAAPLSEADWTDIFASGTTPWQLFDAYVDTAVHARPEADALLDRTRERWRELRRLGEGIFVVLLEEGGTTTGSVLPLEIISEASVHMRVHFEHAFVQESLESISQLERALDHAQRELRRTSRLAPPPRTLLVRFRELPSAVTGGSLGLAAATGCAIHLSALMNARVRWSAASMTALIGSLDAAGAVQPSTDPLVAAKLTALICSPVETVVVPAQHREMAVELVQHLTRSFPNRSLRVEAAAAFSDVLERGEAIRMEDRNPYDRLREFVLRRQSVLLVALFVLAVAISGWFAWKAHYAYPNLEVSLGLKVGTNAVVYNPRDSLEWCFRDERLVKEPVLPFGDLEVGDGFTRNVWIWNMTPSDRDVEVVIEGPDAADWYLNWRSGVLTLPTVKELRMSVMFAPQSAGAKKQAALVLRDPESGDELYRLRLTGAAGAPTPAGYALALDGVDDMLYFGSASTAFDRPQGTLEMWVRPMADRIMNIIYNGSNPPDGEAFASMAVTVIGLDTLAVEFGNTIQRIGSPAEPVFRLGGWTHVAVGWSYLEERVQVFVNGRLAAVHDREFIVEGIGRPHVTIGAFNDRQKHDSHFRGELDGVRVWNRMLSERELRAVMHRRVPILDPEVAGNWDFDATCEVAGYNADGGAHNGTLIGRPTYVRSTAPIDDERDNVRLVEGPLGMPALELGPGRMLQHSRFVLPRFTDATVAFWFRHDTSGTGVYSYASNSTDPFQMHADSLLQISNMNLRAPLVNGWNHLTITTTLEGQVTFWLNGRNTHVHTLKQPEIDVVVDGRRYRGRLQDWHYRYEGMQWGIVDDRYNHFGPKYHFKDMNILADPRAYAQIAVWTRVLAPDEIRALAGGGIPPAKNLVAYWPLDTLPDAGLNIPDRVRALPLHLRRPIPRDVAASHDTATGR